MNNWYARFDSPANSRDLTGFALFVFMILLAYVLANTPLLRAVAVATPEAPLRQTDRASLERPHAAAPGSSARGGVTAPGRRAGDS